MNNEVEPESNFCDLATLMAPGIKKKMFGEENVCDIF